MHGGKTNPDGETADVRYVKGDVAPTERVIGLSAQAISERFTAAARAARVRPRLTAHSGRVGLASELTARGASAHDSVQRADVVKLANEIRSLRVWMIVALVAWVLGQGC